MPYAKGAQKLADLKLLEVYEEPLEDMPEEDLAKEGVQCTTRKEFFGKFFPECGMKQQICVLRFEVTNIETATPEFTTKINETLYSVQPLEWEEGEEHFKNDLKLKISNSVTKNTKIVIVQPQVGNKLYVGIKSTKRTTWDYAKQEKEYPLSLAEWREAAIQYAATVLPKHKPIEVKIKESKKAKK